MLQHIEGETSSCLSRHHANLILTSTIFELLTLYTVKVISARYFFVIFNNSEPFSPIFLAIKFYFYLNYELNKIFYEIFRILYVRKQISHSTSTCKEVSIFKKNFFMLWNMFDLQPVYWLSYSNYNLNNPILISMTLWRNFHIMSIY